VVVGPVVRQVAREVFASSPELDTKSRYEHKEARRRQARLEWGHFSGALIEARHSNNLEHHHVVLFVHVEHSRFLECLGLAMQVLISGHNKSALECLEEAHGLEVHLHHLTQVNLRQVLVSLKRLQVQAVLTAYLPWVHRLLHLIDRLKSILHVDTL